MIKIIGISIIILIIIVIGLVSYLSYEKSKQFKYTIDGVRQNLVPDLFYFDESGEVYVSIKDFSNVLSKKSIKAEYNNGRYKAYNEDVEECNIEQEYEVAGFEQDSEKMYKVILEDRTYEYFTLNKPVKSINGKLYTTKEGLEIGFNVVMEYDKNNNSINMYTLDKLVEIYARKLNNKVINSKDMSFLNKKALKYDMIITSNSSNEYGVQRISSGEMIIGTKYSKLKFIESTKDFIVTTPEDKQGIISTTKNKDIEPQYLEIKQLKDDLNLYLIKNDKGKYGVYNREKQRTIIYPEYDSIGVDVNQFKNENIENQYILYDNCIPCKKSENGIYKWELIDINGNKLINQQFDSLGYIKGTSKNLKGDNLLLIPEIDAIIVNKDSLYGIINSTGKILVKVVMQQIYAESSEGKKTYYMVYNDQTFDVLETLKKSKSTTKSENNDDTTNSENNTTNTTNTTNNTTKNTTNSTNKNTTNNTTKNTTNTENNSAKINVSKLDNNITNV